VDHQRSVETALLGFRRDYVWSGDSRLIRTCNGVGRQHLLGDANVDASKKDRRPAGRRLDLGAQQLTRRTRVLQDRAEHLPALAVELHHLKLLVDAVVSRRGVDLDTGQSEVAGHVL
jgi:hypothetical protein